MAIEVIESTNTPNEGRVIINDNFAEHEGRLNDVEVGVDAFTTTTLSFVQPAAAATVSVSVDNTLWMAVGQPVYMTTGGHYTVSSITDATTVVLTNLGSVSNAAPAVTVASGKKVSPSGEPGAGGGSGDAADVTFTPAGTIAANNVQAAIEEVATDVTDHLSDTSDAHDASAISYAGGTGMSATDVEAAVDELATEKANAADLTAHTGDTSDVHDASAISFVPAGTIAATDVQAAIEEVASEGGGGGGTTLPVADTTAIVKDATDNTKLVRVEAGSIATGTTRVITMPDADVNLGDTATHLADTSDAHDATAISYAGSTTLSATDVEAALDELDTEKVPTTRTVSTTAPLTGGGDLSANRTLAVSAASETASGVAEIATQAETDAGTDDARIVTPLKAATRFLAKVGGTLTGFLTLHADPTSAMHAVTKQYADGLAVGGASPASETVSGIAEIATQTETDAGTDDARIVTPLKLANYSGLGGGSSYKTLVTLGSDVTNSTTSLADVTGLSFAVTSGAIYRFYALIEFTSAAAATGIKLAINGPSGTISVKTNAASSATADSVLHTNTLDTTTNTSTNSFSTAGNIAEITGIIRPSASGTMQVRFASEVAASAIVVKAGSTLEWW